MESAYFAHALLFHGLVIFLLVGGVKLEIYTKLYRNISIIEEVSEYYKTGTRELQDEDFVGLY